MKLCIASDLHVDLFKNGRADIATAMPEADICIIAGDLASINEIQSFSKAKKFLNAMSFKYNHILYITGNHDNWGGNFEDTIKNAQKLEKNFPNFKHLSCSKTVEYQGYKFIGDTLWFKEPDESYFKYMARYWIDYMRVHEPVGAFQAQSDLFERHVLPLVDNKTIVISHHMPSEKCVAQEFMGSDTNCFFVNDQEKNILEKKPLLWVFGHTHYPFDFKIGETRLYANPGGYENEGANRSFMERMIIEI